MGIFLLVLVVFLCVLYFWTRAPRPGAAVTTVKELAEIRRLLAANTRSAGLAAALTARAIPNQRLVVAFGIDNSFTTVCPARYKEFNHHVQPLLNRNRDSRDWLCIGLFSRSLVLSAAPPRLSSLHLAPFLRGYVLTTIIQLFFPKALATASASTPATAAAAAAATASSAVTDANGSEYGHASSTDATGLMIMRLADLIHEMWVQSKNGPPSATSRQQLAATVDALFPWLDSNPLDLLLPAYETLWRVVLRCFLEVQFRGDDCWRQVLLRFLGAPTFPNFSNPYGYGTEGGEGGGEGVGGEGGGGEEGSGEGGVAKGGGREGGEGGEGAEEAVAVEWIVKETLRLYPPTKRIYRATSATESLAADVEALHCCAELWGADADRFRPGRWADIANEAEAELGFMPFGEGTFVCPAKRVFAPRLIAILVAALLDSVPAHAVWTAEREQDRVAAAGRLGNGRGDFASLVLRW